MGPRLFSRGNEIANVYKSAGQETLQWGHDFSAVEIAQFAFACFLKAESFNGATTFQPWKYFAAIRDGISGNEASMGPRLFSRGNLERWISTLVSPGMLQWGHDFSAVEIKEFR